MGKYIIDEITIDAKKYCYDSKPEYSSYSGTLLGCGEGILLRKRKQCPFCENDNLEDCIVHEVLHYVVWKIESYSASDKLDNLCYSKRHKGLGLGIVFQYLDEYIKKRKKEL